MQAVRDNRGLFQSPCGEVVMKVIGLEKSMRRIKNVSVPLRGSGDESASTNRGNCFYGVSVPLRGSGDESFLEPATSMCQSMVSFSPLAGKW